jgi:hypothetical protein
MSETPGMEIVFVHAHSSLKFHVIFRKDIHLSKVNSIHSLEDDRQ